ncbi:MAG: aminotransferase class I/II-fold pyridoxal phosphate-dependent enzyme [Bryobacteraceae bacterium]|nr:aminotransferase class I/II-fold pyridoxal phosphate-dependent enzyme [Bryobacteraceae bacterium]
MQARRIAHFTESVIREMTRLANRHNAVNLAQGFPDFAAPEEIKEAACRAIRDDINQYAITWGAPPLRQAIADKCQRHYVLTLDPETEITVVCGSTEGMVASLLAVADPDEEIVMFEPFYENYGPDADLCSAKRVYVPLKGPDWRFDPDELAAAFSSKTKAIIVNSPNNPTGKVFTLGELRIIASLCQKHNALCITDEIYEHIVYEGQRHIPIMTLDGMRERTILVNSMSKTYSVTGWRVGWVIAAPPLTASIRKVHDFLTVGAAAPLQAAGVVALSSPDSYYAELAAHYQRKRDMLVASLNEAGFICRPPQGAYYVMTDATGFGFSDDHLLARRLIEKAGVAAVPGSSFFHSRHAQETRIRFCFCKKYETLQAAGRLLHLMSSPGRR